MGRAQLSYIEYENKTLALLKEKIIADGCNENNLREKYRYIYHNRLYEFDLVELNENEKIVKVYVIKTVDAIRLNYNIIHRILCRYQHIINADAYIVFIIIMLFSALTDSEKSFNSSYGGITIGIRSKSLLLSIGIVELPNAIDLSSFDIKEST